MGLLNNFEEILIDSNFFFIPFDYKVDVIGKLRERYPTKKIFTLKACYEELRKKETKEAELALKYIDSKDLEIRESGFKGSADERILEYAKNHNIAVCSQDKPLRDKIRKLGRKTIVLRSKQKLEVI